MQFVGLVRPGALLSFWTRRRLYTEAVIKIRAPNTTCLSVNHHPRPLRFLSMEQCSMDYSDSTSQPISGSESHDSNQTACDLPTTSHDSLTKDVHTEVESHDPEKVSCDSKTEDGDPEVKGQLGSLPAKYSTDERYGYLQKGYTTEMFKIEINNIPPRIGFQDLKKHLKTLKLNPAKIKKPETMRNTCFVNFRSEEERQAALKVLNGCVWKKREITAKVAAPAQDPLFKRKRKDKFSDVESQAKRARLEKMSPEERLSEVVTPLLSTPYSDQLKTKEKNMREFLKRATRDILHKEAHPGRWFSDHVTENDGLMCRLQPIRGSPAQSGYRNKCEFTVAMDTTKTKPVVGFRLASYEKGDLTVVSAQSCMHVPDRMKEIVMLFEQYFQTSKLAPFDAKTESGHWRQVTVRCYSSEESMVIVQLHPQDLTQEELSVEKAKLTEYCSQDERSKVVPTAVFFQQLGRRTSNWKPTYEHLLGPEYVHEHLLDLKFRISPDAFFQVNSSAAEVLYSLVRELCVTDIKAPIIYDICCGTGTIGLYLAKMLSARKVIGVEMVEQAILDARVNAEINGVANSEFICGKAEDVMPSLQHPHALKGEVIGVVDPPRAGLHPRVVEAIRKCAPLQRLVYVSCHPDGARKNIVDLCRRASNRIKGLPFRPVSATPVDLFPHTPHCEVVILLERVTLNDLKRDDERVKEEKAKDTTINPSEAELDKGEVINCQDTTINPLETELAKQVTSGDINPECTEFDKSEKVNPDDPGTSVNPKETDVDSTSMT